MPASAADVEQALAVVLEGRQRGMLAEDLGRRAIGEGAAEAHAGATSQMMRQSARASPGIGRNGLCREMRRSELVTVPSFSPQAAAGSRTSA